MEHYFINCTWLLEERNLPSPKCQLFQEEKQLSFKIDTHDILELDIIFKRCVFAVISVAHNIKGSETFQEKESILKSDKKP